MSLTSILRKSIISLSGYWVYRRKHLPVGTDLFEDIHYKINIPVRTIFDVGANIGLTVKENHSAFPGCRIVAFEPIKSTFEKLKANIGGLRNTECHNIALGEKKETLEIKLFDESKSYLNSLKSGAMNQTEGARKETISVNTLDSFLDEHPDIREIDLLKIDTEGFEIQVLKGGMNAIKNGRIKLIYLEAGFSRTNSRSTYYPEIHEFLDAHGFSFFGMYEIANREIAIKFHYGNALFVHDSATGNIKL